MYSDHKIVAVGKRTQEWFTAWLANGTKVMAPSLAPIQQVSYKGETK
jgi:hypothetical protein